MSSWRTETCTACPEMRRMKDSAARQQQHCLDQFARIATKLHEPLTDDEIAALVAELAIIRAMFEWTHGIKDWTETPPVIETGGSAAFTWSSHGHRDREQPVRR
jgi:hypothetical protein